MERLKNITIIFLLAVGLPASAAPAKSASVLLQEGLYAEEIEGDLDAAIKIYEQVIAQAKDTQRAAAQATYRIGMCYLKKGEKAKAAEQFRNLVSKFPEKRSLVTKARRQLAKLEPIGGLGSAELVSVSQLIESGKVPAFKTQIYDNTGLDLETGVTAPLKNEWPDRFDVAWDNDGGGALMINPKSSVRFLALGAAEKWGDAISMARNTFAVLRTSNARGMFARQSKFVAILTSEGNLAVVQIGEYDESQATLYWWLEKLPAHSFAPVIERIIYSEETGKPFFFDLDTAKAFSPPPGLTRASPEREVIEWSATKGIDFVNSRGHLELVEMTTVKVESDMWESATPAEIKDALLKGSTQNFLPTRSKDYTISSPITYVFKTREGGIGILQILEKKDNNLRIRYKMLQERAKTVAVGWRKVFLPDADTPGVNAILDLASGELLPAGERVQQLTVFREMGKGDLAYDRALICIRGGKAKLLQAGKLTNLKIKGQIEDSTAYELPSLPCSLVVTTSEGDNYEVAVMSADNSGANLEYKKMLAEPEEVASVASFGPAKVARLYDIDHPTTTEKECAIDFDTGKLSKIPPQARQMPGDDLMKWLSGSGIDAVAEIAGKESGLIGIDVAVKMLASDEWDTITPQQLRALLAPTHAPRQDTKTMLFEDAPPQPIFSFRTRDSGLGILQILDVDKSKQMVQFRYKMLQGETAQLLVSSHKVFLPECDTTVYDLLDLASSRIINSEPGGEVLDLSKPDGKGNLYFDKAKGQLWLVGVRGTRMRLRSGGELLSSEPDFISRGIAAYYLLGEIPCKYQVTTTQGDKYELKVLSMDAGDRPGVHIEYWKSAESPGVSPAWDAAEAFLAAAVSGRDSDAIRLVKPGSAVVRQVKDFRQILNPEKLKIVSMYADERIAVATTREISVEDQKGLMLIRLIKQRGIWMVEDVDLETPASLKAELDSFLKKHPNAAMLQEPPVRGDAAKAMGLLSGLKALMAGVVGAVESDDPNTALLLLDKLIAQSKQFKSTVKDTSVEAAVKAGLELLDPLRDALEKKQMGRAKSLLAALNQMGPAVESALEKKAAQQKIAAKHSRRLADTIAEMGWDLRTVGKAERGGDLRTFERFDKAEEVFKKALEMDPTNASALKGLAVTCMERKEYGEAIKYYEMWLKAEPNNKDAKAGLEKAKAAKQQ